jgi:hypothetical protein
MRCANPFARAAKRERRQRMPQPLATTKQSAEDLQALIDLFQRLGHSSLEKAIAAQVDCEFFKDLIKRVKANEPIEEFKGVPKAKLLKTLEKLLSEKQKVQTGAWSLPAKARSLLKTTVKSYVIKGEALPCYDVAYEAGSGRDAVKIRISTRRRSLEVTLHGSEESLDSTSKALILRMLK